MIIFDILTTAKHLLLTVNSSANSDNNGYYKTSTELITTNKTNLPTISLKTFYGEYEQWSEFKDSFIYSVHNDETISAFCKFQYLKSVLSEKALAVIENIKITADNYKIAWNLLNERFEDKFLLVNSHIKAIFDIPPMQKESYAK